MAMNDSFDLMERIRRNAAHISTSYQSANALLDTAIMEAFPWVLGLPVVRGKIPPMFRAALPQGSQVTLDKLERLITQLYAILAASYTPTGGQLSGMEQGIQEKAKITPFKER